MKVAPPFGIRDDEGGFRHCERSVAIHGTALWIATAFGLAMTGGGRVARHPR